MGYKVYSVSETLFTLSLVHILLCIKLDNVQYFLVFILYDLSKSTTESEETLFLNLLLNKIRVKNL